jgi:hypothetical protein
MPNRSKTAKKKAKAVRKAAMSATTQGCNISKDVQGWVAQCVDQIANLSEIVMGYAMQKQKSACALCQDMSGHLQHNTSFGEWFCSQCHVTKTWLFNEKKNENDHAHFLSLPPAKITQHVFPSKWVQMYVKHNLLAVVKHYASGINNMSCKFLTKGEVAILVQHCRQVKATNRNPTIVKQILKSTNMRWLIPGDAIAGILDQLFPDTTSLLNFDHQWVHTLCPAVPDPWNVRLREKYNHFDSLFRCYYYDDAEYGNNHLGPSSFESLFHLWNCIDLFSR